MASKKEHKRKQKSKGKPRNNSPKAKITPLYQTRELNYLDLAAKQAAEAQNAVPVPETTETLAAESANQAAQLPPEQVSTPEETPASAPAEQPSSDNPYSESSETVENTAIAAPPPLPDIPAHVEESEPIPDVTEEAKSFLAPAPASEALAIPSPVPEPFAMVDLPEIPEPAPVVEKIADAPSSVTAPLDLEPAYWEKEAPVPDAPAPAAATPFVEYGYQAPAPVAPAPPMAEVKCADTASGYSQGTPAEDDQEWTMPDHRTTRFIPKEKSLYIVMITPEVAPCAKVGGLGDVVQGLGRELVNRGHGVESIAPMYSCMRYETIEDLHEVYGELWCPHYNQWRAEKVFQGRVGGGLQANFITGSDYTERDAIYGYPDDLYRFTYFCRQALEFMFKTDRRPDIIHCHDWATGIVAPMLWDIYQPLGWDNSRVVYTIHNNECQGLCGFGDKLLGMVGMDVKKYHRPDKMQDDVHANCINLMKGGIVFSNFTTTVSPTFAGELKTVAGGRGLQTTIAKNSAKIGGVLNGLDYDTWNPQTDAKLAARYSIGEDFYEKYKNKTALREWLGLWDSWKPIVSVVTRLTQQKGLDLIKRAIFSTLEEDGQFVLLGSAPDPKVNDDFLRLQHQLKDNHDVNLYIGYHEDLSRIIYAGSDLFLVPSLFEPCGLTQMIALRYGTVPVVRETGGLVDTVFDLENSGRGLTDANGFTFRDPTPESLDYGLKRALRLWYDNPAAFNRLARNGMSYNYSWKNPASDYENIYNFIKA